MARIVEIDNCDDCPFFDNQYYNYLEWCEHLRRRIPPTTANYSGIYCIPEDCPLPKKEQQCNPLATD